MSYEVTNEGTEDMPFFMGGHPGFRCPLDEGESYDDYELRFEKREATELCTAVPSTGLIDVEHRSKNPMIGHDLPLTHELFDSRRPSLTCSRAAWLRLTKKTEDKGVRLTFPDMPYLIVWSKPEGDFVAVEPWGGLSTCSDEDDILEHKRGCLVAKPERPSLAALRSRSFNELSYVWGRACRAPGTGVQYDSDRYHEPVD